MLVFSVQAGALASEPGYLVPISQGCSGSGINLSSGIEPQVTVSAASSTTFLTLTIFSGVTGNIPPTGGSTLIYATPYNVIFEFGATPSNSVVAITPKLNSSGQQTGFSTSTGTYTGSIGSDGYGGYTIAASAHFTAGPLSGGTCNLTGATFYVGN